MQRLLHPLVPILCCGCLLLRACNQRIVSPSSGDRLNVVATTNIVGDVVSQVGGDLIDMSVMLPVGSDPHSFDPTPQDVAKVADADVVFANGAGLEEFLEKMIETAGASDKVIYVSTGIDFLVTENHNDSDSANQDNHGGIDPHTWTNPMNVMVWVANIENGLSELDPLNAEVYAANTAIYSSKLQELDTWIREQVTQIPKENREIVTDHSLFGYYVNEYGFEQVATLIPGYSTLAEPSARDIATIEDVIINLNVKAIFVGKSINPTLARRVSEDTGTQLVFIYTGSLSEPNGDAAAYIDYMRYNTTTFVEALK
jgi:ABC-type Zn uptake system ZnuABC Zn-binding protein ZnuA